MEGMDAWSVFEISRPHQSLYNREKIFNDVILIGSCNDARSLAAVVGRCPALGVTVKALLGEFPQVLFFHWYRRTIRYTKNSIIFVNLYSITEELACKTRNTRGAFKGERERERERER